MRPYACNDKAVQTGLTGLTVGAVATLPSSGNKPWIQLIQRSYLRVNILN